MPGLLECHLSAGGCPEHKNATETNQENSSGWRRKAGEPPLNPATAIVWDSSEATQTFGLSPVFLAMLLLL